MPISVEVRHTYIIARIYVIEYRVTYPLIIEVHLHYITVYIYMTG